MIDMSEAYATTAACRSGSSGSSPSARTHSRWRLSWLASGSQGRSPT